MLRSNFKLSFIFLLIPPFFDLKGLNAQDSISKKIEYVCMPCGMICDNEKFDEPGFCSVCKMKLVDKQTISHNSIAPSELKSFLNSTKDLIILDVRTKLEFDGKSEPNFGTLKKAINIPISEIEQGGYKQLNKDKTILVYCSHAHRSAIVSYILTQNGFKNVINLTGGMSQVNDLTLKK